MRFLGRRFNDKLGCIDASLTAGEAESGGICGGKSKIESTVAGDQRCYIDRCPGARAKETGARGNAIHGGRVGIVDRPLDPRRGAL